jgi:uncharacterized repeat protein (TIGR01451 family)
MNKPLRNNWRARPTLAWIASLAATVVCASANAQTFKVTEPFTGTSAPDWTLSGTAVLTAPGIDADGSGWLRLTSITGGSQSGQARYTGGSFASNQSIVVKIGYVAWGGTGADGTTVFLYDSTKTMSGTTSGGGLGYCGGDGGYLAIGLDEYGNFSNPADNCHNGGPGLRPDTLVIRGPYANVPANPYVTGTAISGGIDNPGVSTRPSEKTVLLIMEPVTPGSGYKITAKFQSSQSSSFQTLFQDVSFPYTAPASLSIGFSGSTGGSTNYHELHAMAVSTPSDLTTALSGPGSAERGDAVTYTFSVTNNGLQAIDNINAPTITSNLPAGITNVTWSCATGTGGATCANASGGGNINSTTLSLPAGGSVIYTIHGTVSPTLACKTALSVTASADFNPTSSNFTDINPNDNSGSVTTTTSCTASPDHASLSFTGRAISTTSAAQTVVLSGTGGAVVSSISSSGDFAQSNNCSIALDDSSCTINVTFTPTAGGSRTGTLSITTSASSTPITVSLSGNGMTASTNLGSLGFSALNVGSNSTQQSITLSGNGGTTVSNVSVTGDFSQTNNCDSALSGTNCAINVTFSPTSQGSRAGTLNITTSASATPISISLSGTGLMAASVDQSSLSFGSLAVSSGAAQSITLSGTGGATVSNVSVTGDFSQTNNCGSALSGTSCTINVTFSPTATGNLTGTLNITTSASATPISVSLSGIGTMSASINHGSVSFDSQKINTGDTQDVTLSGTGGVTVDSIIIGGDFTQTNDCNVALNNSTCTIHITFKPTAQGALASTLQIITSASSTPIAVTLTGTGYPTVVVESGGSGAMDYWLLAAMLIIASIRLLHARRVRGIITTVMLFTALTNANALEPFSTKNLYVGAKLGTADSSLSEDALMEGLSNRGYDVTGEITDTHTSGGIYVGYDLNKSWAVELGFSYLGQVRATFSGPTSDIDGLMNAAADITRGSGDSLWLVGRYRYSFNPSIAVDLRAGPYRWHTNTDIYVESIHSLSRSDNGFGYTLGVAPRFAFAKKFGTGVSVDYFSSTSENHIWQATVFLDYHF